MGNQMNIDFGRFCQLELGIETQILRACRFSITPPLGKPLIAECSACVAQAQHSKAAQLIYLLIVLRNRRMKYEAVFARCRCVNSVAFRSCLGSRPRPASCACSLWAGETGPIQCSGAEVSETRPRAVD